MRFMEEVKATYELGIVRSNRLLGAIPTSEIDQLDIPADQNVLNISDIYSAYDLQRAKNVWKGEESDYFGAYLKEYQRNAFMVFCIETPLSMIFREGYHFEGPGAEEARSFWAQEKLDEKLRIAVRHMLWCGNGYLSRRMQGDKLVGADYINGFTVFFEEKKMKSGKIKVEMFQRTKHENKIPLKQDNIIHLKALNLGHSYYGMSLVRPNLYFLMALRDTMGDIPAAVKRVAYAPMVAYLDLEGFKDQEEKKKIIKDYGDKLHAVISATTNYVMDKKHQLQLADGAAQNLDSMQVMTPLLSIVFLNFSIPLGTFLQSDANKNILEAQLDFAWNGIKMLQDNIAAKINAELLPLVTNKEVKLVWDDNNFIKWNKFRLLYHLYNAGAISREYLLDNLNIEDKGNTFIEVAQPRRTLPGGGI